MSTGETYYYELIFEFFTVGYTVSFRVDWAQKVDLRFFCGLLREQN